MKPETLRWWERPWFPWLLAALAAVPLIGPNIPPLVDLPGHMAHIRIQIDYAHDATLRQFYVFEPWVIGNLGVDLLVAALAPLVGFEPAVKLVVTAIPPLTVLGFLWAAREVHGRGPPTALFAVPLAYCFPFNFGFVNFALSMALAFLAFALWLRLGRLGRLRLRAGLFVLVTLLLWLCHAFGWATFCVLAAAAETESERRAGRPWFQAAWRAVPACWPLAAPIVPMIVWRTGPVEGDTLGWNPVDKVNYLLTPFRDRWQWLDLGSLVLVAGLCGYALLGRRLGFDRRLALAALAFLLCYLLLPRQLFGSSYADLRLAPFLLATAVLAIRVPAQAGPRFAAGLAVLGLVFVLVRFAAATFSAQLYAAAFERELIGLDHVPRGARMLTLVGTACRNHWTMTRLDHLPGFAVIRRDAFSNDQWSVRGAQLVRARLPEAGRYARDPSQIVRIGNCSVNRWPTIDESLRDFPRAPFDYLWLVNPPPYDARLIAGLAPVWTNGRSALFRIPHPAPPAGAAGRPAESGASGLRPAPALTR